MTQAWLWWAAGAAALIAVASGLAEWRRSARRDLDRIGVVPWGAISMIAFVGAVVALGVAIKQ